MTYQFSKYATTIDELKTTLDKYGVAIIPSVLNDEECDNIVSGIWDCLEHVSSQWPVSIDRLNPSTWKLLSEFFPLHSMLIQHFGIGHCQAAWDVRQNVKLVSLFAHLWKCSNEDLLVSFDGLSFHPPPEIVAKGYNRNNTWFHTDQSFTRNSFECVQSWVTGLDVEKGDATLSFMESSHKFHEMCARKFNIVDKSNWYKLSREQEDFYLENGCRYGRIKCPKGSVVFWDSRTIHCGVESERGRQTPKFRAVIYACFAPKIMATEKDLEKKRAAFRNQRTTSHWPCKVKMFAKNPRTYGRKLAPMTLVPPPVLSDLGVKLAGF
jgi:hypothetical protein